MLLMCEKSRLGGGRTQSYTRMKADKNKHRQNDAAILRRVSEKGTTCRPDSLRGIIRPVEVKKCERKAVFWKLL